MINGQTGQAAVIQVDGRTYVDLETLAHIANGSLTFKANRIVLNLPPSTASTPAAVGPPTQADRPQLIAGFHAGWNGNDSTDEGVGQSTGIRHSEWISSDRKLGCRLPRTGRARSQSRIGGRLTDADRGALQLLTNEFEAVREWSNKLVEARKSMNTGAICHVR